MKVDDMVVVDMDGKVVEVIVAAAIPHHLALYPALSVAWRRRSTTHSTHATAACGRGRGWLFGARYHARGLFLLAIFLVPGR